MHAIMSSNLIFKRMIHRIVDLADKRAVQIIFKDGTGGLFPYVWLRDSSLDPTTYSISSAMKARQLFMRDFDVRVSPKKVQFDADNNALCVEWPDEVFSRYDHDWLKTRNPSSALVQEHRKKVYLSHTKLWTRDTIERRLKRFKYREFLINDEVLHDFLTAVCVDGIALLTEGSIEGPQVLKEVAQRIGFAQRTHFGETFEVFRKPDASNMAYASIGELPYHTDFPSLADPPQLQLLHMCQRADQGGFSMFVDGFNIAKIMKKQDADAFRLLCTTPLEYIEEGFDVHELNGEELNFSYDMISQHTVFNQDAKGEVNRVQFGNAMRSWFYEVSDPLEIQRVYDALKLFTDYCYQPDNQLIFPLESGDTVLWANTRVLHGRTAYSSTSAERERKIVGCYFAWDIVKSKIRLIRDKLNLPENQQTV